MRLNFFPFVWATYDGISHLYYVLRVLIDSQYRSACVKMRIPRLCCDAFNGGGDFLISNSKLLFTNLRIATLKVVGHCTYRLCCWVYRDNYRFQRTGLWRARRTSPAKLYESTSLRASLQVRVKSPN